MQDDVEPPRTPLTDIFAETFDPELLDSFPLAEHSIPQGWLNLIEMQVLYTAARRTAGPILEIGSWLGRSTCALAAGVRDNPRSPTFDSVDFGITSATELEGLLGVSFADYARNDTVVRTIHSPGGSIGRLIDGLRGAGLLDHVTSIIRGDVLKAPLRARYDLIFCDTLHDEREIRLYSDLLRARLAPGGWLIADDVISDEIGGLLLQELVGLSPLLYSKPADSSSKFAIGRRR